MTDVGVAYRLFDEEGNPFALTWQKLLTPGIRQALWDRPCGWCGQRVALAGTKVDPWTKALVVVAECHGERRAVPVPLRWAEEDQYGAIVAALHSLFPFTRYAAQHFTRLWAEVHDGAWFGNVAVWGTL